MFSVSGHIENDNHPNGSNFLLCAMIRYRSKARMQLQEWEWGGGEGETGADLSVVRSER